MPQQIINGIGRMGVRIVSSQPSYDADAQAFITAAALTDTTQKNAINDLVLDLKGAGIWTKMKALYPFVGGTAASHKWNLKDARDLDAAYRLTFNGGWTHSSTGALPNGTTAYADTSLIPSTAGLGQNSTHISYYSRTNNDAGIDMGSTTNSTTGRLYLFTKIGNTFGARNNNNTASEPFISNLNGVGHYINNRIDSSNIKLTKNGSTTTLALTSNGVDTRQILIGAVFVLPNTYNYGSKQCAFASIGDGLTDLESNLFYQIVEKYQYALGRNVNPNQSFYYNRNYTNETNAFIFNGAISDATQISAVNTLVTTLKTAGIWTKMKAVYPMVGGTALAHKFNLVNPVDSTSAYALTFAGGWTHTSTGALPNGSNTYANTSLNPSVNLAGQQNNMHLSYYSRTNINSNMDIAMNTWTSPYTYMYIRSSNLIASRFNTGNAENTTSNTNSLGLFILNRTLSTSLTFFRNGNPTVLSQNSTGISNGNILLGGNTAISDYGSKECAFASIGDGLTDAEATTFYNAVQAFQTTLGRQV